MKSRILKLSVLLTLTLVISCDNEQLDTETQESNAIKYSEMELGSNYYGKSAPTDCHFEYEGDQGPEFWATLCGDEWKDCGGNVQSPIDIITSAVIEDGDINNINFNYGESRTDILNNGHTIQFTYDDGSYASLNNINYNLLQFHFHTGSEHTIDGKRYPMEMHLVHQDPITKLLGVVGIFFEEGEENQVLATYLNDLPEKEDNHFISASTFKVEDLLPEDMDFYTYSGSLTTPACSEIVSWYVVKETVTASSAQLSRFKSIMHENYRPAQKTNERIVRTKG